MSNRSWNMKRWQQVTNAVRTGRLHVPVINNQVSTKFFSKVPQYISGNQLPSQVHVSVPDFSTYLKLMQVLDNWYKIRGTQLQRPGRGLLHDWCHFRVKEEVRVVWRMRVARSDSM